MAMNSPRWTAITESQFPSEREVLEWLRGHLPNHGSWHAWTNFEFVDDEGKVAHEFRISGTWIIRRAFGARW